MKLNETTTAVLESIFDLCHMCEQQRAFLNAYFESGLSVNAGIKAASIDVETYQEWANMDEEWTWKWRPFELAKQLVRKAYTKEILKVARSLSRTLLDTISRMSDDELQFFVRTISEVEIDRGFLSQIKDLTRINQATQ